MGQPPQQILGALDRLISGNHLSHFGQYNPNGKSLNSTLSLGTASPLVLQVGHGAVNKSLIDFALASLIAAVDARVLTFALLPILCPVTMEDRRPLISRASTNVPSIFGNFTLPLTRVFCRESTLIHGHAETFQSSSLSRYLNSITFYTPTNARRRTPDPSPRTRTRSASRNPRTVDARASFASREDLSILDTRFPDPVY